MEDDSGALPELPAGSGWSREESQSPSEDLGEKIGEEEGEEKETNIFQIFRSNLRLSCD